MKKFFLVFSMLMLSITTRAQFVVYKSVEQKRMEQSLPTSTQTVRGYYHDMNGWHVQLLKVTTRGNTTFVSAYKTSWGWEDAEATVSSVSYLDPNEIQESFAYKVNLIGKTVYF